ncbi:MAG: hypothetical protein QXK33_00910 [Candidatus Bathyarchaeia archaeon]
MSYKEMLFKFLEDDLNVQYCLPIVKKLLQANLRGGNFVITIDKNNEKLIVKPDEIRTQVQTVLDFVVKKALLEGYNVLVTPCIISKEQAPNFYLEEEIPKPEELWRFLYLLLTGVHSFDYVLNLENTPAKITESFRKWLMNKNYLVISTERSGLNVKELLSSLKIPKGLALEEFIMSFIFLSYFAKFWKDTKEEIEIARDSGTFLSEIPDDTSLVIFVLSRQKKRMYVFPRLKETLTKYYGDFFLSDDQIPSICRFIFSLYISDVNYREICVGILNKLLYYLLQGHINGELLSRAIELKINYELKKKEHKIFGLQNAPQFFTKL